MKEWTGFDVGLMKRDAACVFLSNPVHEQKHESVWCSEWGEAGLSRYAGSGGDLALFLSVDVSLSPEEQRQDLNDNDSLSETVHY